MVTKITKDDTLAKIIKKEGADEVLMKNGVPCLSCPMGSQEIDKLKAVSLARGVEVLRMTTVAAAAPLPKASA